MADLVQNEQQAKSSSRSNEESSKSESLEDKNSFGEKLVPPNASSTPKSEDSEDELANTRTFSSENKLNSPENTNKSWKKNFCVRYYAGIPKRYVLLFMTFLGFVHIYSMRVNLNVALVAMVNNYTIIRHGIEITRVSYLLHQ